MKKNINYSGIEICDSIVMSVKKRKLSLRKFEAGFFGFLLTNIPVVAIIKSVDFIATPKRKDFYYGFF